MVFMEKVSPENFVERSRRNEIFLQKIFCRRPHKEGSLINVL